MEKTTVSIARKHIMAAIESAPCELEFKRYIITSKLHNLKKSGGYDGVKVTWKIK